MGLPLNYNFICAVGYVVLACYNQASIPASITLVSEKHTAAVCQTLLSIPVMTVCDTVSCLVGKGKKKALNIIQDDHNARDAVQIQGPSSQSG